MEARRRDAVTGAFAFTGRVIAERLLASGRDVLTLTRRAPAPGDPLAGKVATAPMDFARPDDLVAALRGVDTLYNTYWIRFSRGSVSFERALGDTAVLIDAARRSEIRRFVHVSVVNADPSAPTAYFRAKAALEQILGASGLSYAIVRPTLTFGRRDILINNLAWALRHLPMVGIPGGGRYPIQPVHVDDVARITLERAARSDDLTVDAAGPETFEYRELVEMVRRAVGSRARLVAVPPIVMAAAARLVGLAVRDVVLTRDELIELTHGLLVSNSPPTGQIRFSEWLAANGGSIGRHYASELARHYRAVVA